MFSASSSFNVSKYCSYVSFSLLNISSNDSVYSAIASPFSFASLNNLPYDISNAFVACVISSGVFPNGFAKQYKIPIGIITNINIFSNLIFFFVNIFNKK